MAKIATAAKAKQNAKQSKKQRGPKVTEVELGTRGATLLDQLANARSDRLAAQKIENPLKEDLKELYGVKAGKLKKGDTLVVKALGVVRGRVTVKGPRLNVDYDLLLEAFPEAYAACVTQSTYTQFDPA